MQEIYVYTVHFLVSILFIYKYILPYKPWYVNPKTAEKIMKYVFGSDIFSALLLLLLFLFRFSLFHFSHSLGVVTQNWYRILICVYREQKQRRTELKEERVRQHEYIFACYFIYNWYPNIYKMPLSMISIRVFGKCSQTRTHTRTHFFLFSTIWSVNLINRNRNRTHELMWKTKEIYMKVFSDIETSIRT